MQAQLDADVALCRGLYTQNTTTSSCYNELASEFGWCFGQGDRDAWAGAGTGYAGGLRGGSVLSCLCVVCNAQLVRVCMY